MGDQDGLIGVGIVFQPTEDGTLYVKKLKQGEPAQRSGLIHPGDCLCEINGRDVFRQPVDTVKSLIMGPPGSTVRLGFHRGTDPRAKLIQVALQRNKPGEQMVGVGIVFRSDTTGALFVRMLQDGGPAQLSGEVKVGDCIVEVDGADVYRKPISTFTSMVLGPPGSVVMLGLRREDTLVVHRVMLRRNAPIASKDAVTSQSQMAVYDGNIKLRRQLEAVKEEHQRLQGVLIEKRRQLKEAERLYEHGASGMGGQMNEEAQRLKTFAHWPHSDTTHPGVTPVVLASDGFHFAPTAQDPDMVICFFCDVQLGDWERADDAKAVHRKLSPNCPLCIGIPCGNKAIVKGAASKLDSGASAQQKLEDVLMRKALLLQTATALEGALDDARRQIGEAVQARRRIQAEAQAIALQRRQAGD
mmetsp:Transcript_26057/g.65798  ORF Transcript_26057/g.65798 Transcript_26057/m.65798 type:complete len:414 (+) Transcript_26057:67-1308(+)